MYNKPEQLCMKKTLYRSYENGTAFLYVLYSRTAAYTMKICGRNYGEIVRKQLGIIALK